MNRDADFFRDFDLFTTKILGEENFAFVRYGDGEKMLMSGGGVGRNTQAFRTDNWFFEGGDSVVSKQLWDSLLHTEKNYFFGIPAEMDNENCYNFFVENINSTQFSLANLWINANYEKMMGFYRNLREPVTLIANKNAKKENFPFEIKKFFAFEDDCVHYWEKTHDSYMRNLINYVKTTKNELFFFAAGPISEIMIDLLYKTNPNNRYIDVGSSIDEFVHQKKTRPYMTKGTYYSKLVSNFSENHYET